LVPGLKAELASLISYQDGSVVSRAILNTRAGTVTLFAFDEGEGLSEHSAPYDALVQLIEGDAEVTIAGKKNRLAAGEAIVLPAGEPHTILAIKRFKMLLTMVRSS
jgi:quercetin dioxygenase-like cupin family protein